MKSAHYYIYMLECENGKYYTGYSVDVEKRYSLHVKGKGAKFTKIYKPIRMAQLWKIRCTIGDAMKVEAFIKSKNKKFKDELVKKPSILKRSVLEKLGLTLKFIKINKSILYLPDKFD